MGRMLVLLCDSLSHESVGHVIGLTKTAIGKSYVVLETIKLGGKKLEP